LAAPDTHFTLLSNLPDPEARLEAFRQYGRPSIGAWLSSEIERGLQVFAGDARYRLVHVSRLYLAPLAAAWMRASGKSPLLVLDCDEDDASAYRRFARLYRHWGHSRKARWAEMEADGFKALASRWLPRFDLLLAASCQEARLLQAKVDSGKVIAVPNVSPPSAARGLRPQAREGRREILFVGNMSYAPNIDAAKWFALRIWPLLRTAVPFPLRFVIVGPGAPPDVVALGRQPDIVVAGGRDDVAPFYRRASLAVVPIRAGGGTRIKLLEGARYGVPLVATRLGAEGTDFRAGQELLLADTERDFAASCARLLTDGKLGAQLAARALTKAMRDHDARRGAAHLLAAVDAMIDVE
jgi:glycosyltransferase involved in cell wall biosynthesis